MQLFACGWASHSNLSVIEFMIDLECMQFNTSMQYSYRIIALVQPEGWTFLLAPR